jgi:hypothetical protein
MRLTGWVTHGRSKLRVKNSASTSTVKFNNMALTGKSKSKVFQAACRTVLVGYAGPPGEVKL